MKFLRNYSEIMFARSWSTSVVLCLATAPSIHEYTTGVLRWSLAIGLFTIVCFIPGAVLWRDRS